MPEVSSERRNESRHRLALTGSNPVVVTTGVLPRAAVLSDLSPLGLGMVTTFAPPVGSVLPVWLPGQPGEASRLVLVNVVHVRPSSDNLYQVGAACHDDVSAAGLCELSSRLGHLRRA